MQFLGMDSQKSLVNYALKCWDYLLKLSYLEKNNLLYLLKELVELGFKENLAQVKWNLMMFSFMRSLNLIIDFQSIKVILVYTLIQFIEEFVKAFRKVKDFPIFNWLPKLVDGYSKEYMNIDDSRTSDLARRLTSISNEKSKAEVESMGFDSHESENLQLFF